MAQVKTVPNQVKVAYIGIQVENVESWVKSELETKLNAIFNGGLNGVGIGDGGLKLGFFNRSSYRLCTWWYG